MGLQLGLSYACNAADSCDLCGGTGAVPLAFGSEDSCNRTTVFREADLSCAQAAAGGGGLPCCSDTYTPLTSCLKTHCWYHCPSVISGGGAIVRSSPGFFRALAYCSATCNASGGDHEVWPIDGNATRAGLAPDSGPGQVGSMNHGTLRLLPILLVLALQACAATTTLSPPPDAAFYEGIVAAPDRDETDRALDAGRHPAETLRFFGIAPGMRVAEISAGGGYTAELLARAVGPKGKVYGHNAPFVLKRFAEAPWSARLAKPVMSNVVRVDGEFAEALPPDVKDLDAVLNVLFYHDTVWQGVDRDRMNRMVFEALRPGGVYGIVDHSAREGSGLADVETLHRIEEKTLREEIEKAGFRLDASADFLRNPADARDWNDSPRAAADRRGTSDRFVLKFVKP